MVSYEEAADALRRQADDISAAMNVAGDLLRECERLRVPPPWAVRVEGGWPVLDWSGGDVWLASVQCRPDGRCRARPDGLAALAPEGGMGAGETAEWLSRRFGGQR